MKLIEERVNVQSFNTWFLPLSLENYTNDNIVIGVPRPYFASWLEEHYLPLLTRTAEELLGKNVSFRFVVVSEEPSPVHSNTPDPQKNEKPPVIPQNVRGFSFEQQIINPRFTFDSFVVGNSNQFAHAASKAVADSPGKTAFNPLVIYSGVGLGKTHILQGIAHRCLDSGNGIDRDSIIYVSSEKFTMDFILSIQNNCTAQLTNYYRHAKLLLVDDIQFFNNKERTQEEFFHIFNALHQSGRQIVLTMDRPPSQLKGLADRLINRFQWGLVTDIQPPDFETRVAILKKKAESDGVQLDNSVTEYIAENITSNIRELEGALIRLLAFSSLHGQDISISMAERVLGDTFSMKSKIITIESIQKLVAEHFSLSTDQIMGNSRRKEIALARHLAIFLCKQLTDSSLKTIGLHFGGRDHSTVIHSLKIMESSLKSDPELARHAHQLSEKAKKA